MYFHFTFQSFKDISFFVFKDRQKPSLSALLDRDNIYFFIKILRFDKFFKNLFIVYFPEDTIRVFIYKIENIIIKIKKSLVEKGFFKSFSGRDLIRNEIVVKKIIICYQRLWFFLISAKKLFQGFIDGLSFKAHPDLFMRFKSSEGINIIFSIVQFK